MLQLRQATRLSDLHPGSMPTFCSGKTRWRTGCHALKWQGSWDVPRRRCAERRKNWTKGR
jgi:hypothetical protein